MKVEDDSDIEDQRNNRIHDSNSENTPISSDCDSDSRNSRIGEGSIIFNG